MTIRDEWISPCGEHRLILGDCVEVLPTLEAGSVDAVVTSPPYNQLGGLPAKGSGLWGRSAGGAGFLRAWNDSGYSDSMSEPEYQEWQRLVFSQAHGVCGDMASLFYNHQLRWRDGMCIHPVSWFTPDGWRLRSEIVWDRGGGMMFNARMFVRFDERILWFIKGNTWKWNQQCIGYGTVWRIAREQQQQGKQHPVAFPVQVPERCIVATTNAGDVVLDPFSGSGTTGVACVRTGRRFIGIEISEQYFSIAIDRVKAELDRHPLFEEPKPEQMTLGGDLD